ncbi:RES family NAD+ phosphorylase [Chelativorans salis]|uniref:RES family NAD+ phosphorylase n=1 Tax=Chelativorans salis TaxID=2978478 RepID=A0ABT2LN62_9HYPH|nr:RES family NAD+ phosphorylase [Chelativorans sp. EGI FJ00035]MCT7376005.1 RES family NAD+ phosphorylase [Chelativorans sp. EGI FJ00035]
MSRIRRVHDPALLDTLASLPQERFSGEVFRVTPMNKDPTAFSNNGGRWAPEPSGAAAVQILYTSLEKEGALAEVVSYLLLQNPTPTKPLCLHRLRVTTSKTLRIIRAEFASLGIEEPRYEERNYGRTQEIGAAVSFLECDGLIAPSARWPCDNLMIYGDNHSLDETLEPIDSEVINWFDWAREKGLHS